MNFKYIADNKELELCISSLKNCTEIAIDLEFDKNRYRYGFNLCLMQIFDGRQCFIIDPLSKNLDIELIFPLLQDPDIQKVAFAFSEDLRLLHSIGCFPKNIFDLDIITSLLNFAPASLMTLLKDVLDVDVEKSSQQSNWFRRPLSNKQLVYAAEDVIYLLRLKEVLVEQAKQAEILEWVNQENEIRDLLDYSDEDHNVIIKEKDKKGLSVFEWYIFTQLLEFIDSVAKRYDKPSYQIINKEYLAQVAQDPHKLEEWEETGGIYRKLKTPIFKNKIKEVLDRAVSEAEEKGLSKTDQADKPLSKEEFLELREEQKRISWIKSQIFIPIQQRIAEDYGNHVKSFILSNRQMREFIVGEGILPEYKKELFRAYADELGIDISEFINSERMAS